MKYRKFGRTDLKISVLGFGAMRLPTIDKEPANINEEEAIRMIRYAIDKGVNYIDTAWPYHNGNSEILVGKALKDGYREKVKVATKLPVWSVEKIADADEILDKQLEKLDLAFIDFYLLHALNRNSWEKMKSLNILQWLERVRDEGKIKYIGFSFHDEYKVFKEIVDAYDWDFCQIQYNYLDTEYQAGKKGLQYAHDKGLAVVIMEPLRGGLLAGEAPVEVKRILKDNNINNTMADLALQWLWNQKEVNVVLSGMSNLQQVKENIISANSSAIGDLSLEELDVIEEITDKMRGPITCTRCSYCMPCPNGVNIPENFYLFNTAKLYNKYEENKERYQSQAEENKADNCIRCGKCEKVCLQNLPIMNLLEEVAAFFHG